MESGQNLIPTSHLILVVIRHTSSANAASTVDSVLIIGGVRDVFSSTTVSSSGNVGESSSGSLDLILLAGLFIIFTARYAQKKEKKGGKKGDASLCTHPA